MEAALASTSCAPNVASISLFVMLAFQFSIVFFFLRRLRQRHADVWNDLGSPTLFWNNSIRNGLLVTGFIFRRRHAQLRDRTLMLLGDTTLAVWLIYLTIFTLAWVGAVPLCTRHSAL